MTTREERLVLFQLRLMAPASSPLSRPECSFLPAGVTRRLVWVAEWEPPGRGGISHHDGTPPLTPGLNASHRVPSRPAGEGQRQSQRVQQAG